MTIGFVPDGQPRSNEAIQHPSGLWVAGDTWIDHHERTPGEPQGTSAVVAVAPAYDPPRWAGRARRVEASDPR